MISVIGSLDPVYQHKRVVKPHNSGDQICREAFYFWLLHSHISKLFVNQKVSMIYLKTEPMLFYIIKSSKNAEHSHIQYIMFEYPVKTQYDHLLIAGQKFCNLLVVTSHLGKLLLSLKMKCDHRIITGGQCHDYRALMTKYTITYELVGGN